MSVNRIGPDVGDDSLGIISILEWNMATFDLPAKAGGEQYQWNFINESTQSIQVNMNALVNTNYFGATSLTNTPSLMLYQLDSVVLPTPPQQIYVYPAQDNGVVYTAGNITINPGQTVIFTGNHLGTNGDIQLDLGPTETLYINGQWLNSSYEYPTINALPDAKGKKEYINLVGGNGFTVTENTPTENNVTGNNVLVDLGGAGSELATTNICFQIFDQSTDVSYNHIVWNGTPTFFVNSLYKSFFQRSSDASGLQFWTELLQTDKASRADEVKLFISSPEFKANNYSDADSITLLYHSILNREPDSAGFNYWREFAQHYTDKSQAISVIGVAFLGSSEALSLSNPAHYPLVIT